MPRAPHAPAAPPAAATDERASNRTSGVCPTARTRAGRGSPCGRCRPPLRRHPAMRTTTQECRARRRRLGGELRPGRCSTQNTESPSMTCLAPSKASACEPGVVMIDNSSAPYRSYVSATATPIAHRSRLHGPNGPWATSEWTRMKGRVAGPTRPLTHRPTWRCGPPPTRRCWKRCGARSPPAVATAPPSTRSPSTPCRRVGIVGPQNTPGQESLARATISGTRDLSGTARKSAD